MNDKLRVGLVGIGRGTAYGHLFSVNPLTEVAALCDFDENKLARSGKEDLDIVVLGTPMPYHADQVVAAIEADCHVLSEVTAASDLDGCMRIHKAVTSHPKLKYMMAENCCYMAFALEWKDIVD